MLFSKWKVITGTLLRQRHGGQLQPGDPRNKSVDEAIREIDSVLEGFVASDVNIDQRHKNLGMIMNRSAQLAFVMFSQPGSFQFDFSGSERAGNLVVFPGLSQVIGDDGQPMYPHGRQMLEKEIEATSVR